MSVAPRALRVVVVAGFVRALALDLDGTLTDGERLSDLAITAVDRIRDDGLVAALVTGRIVADLDAAFPGVRDHFDAVVAENGAVLVLGDEVHDLAEPVEEELASALRQQDISLGRGRVLLATDARHAQAVLASLETLGLDCQIVRNRGALMVLPAGVSKGTGLLAALGELGISAHNAVAVGDAENDLALLHTAEVGIAVANAVPSLREHADLVLDERNGAGIAGLLAGPVLSGEQLIQPARRRLPIGRFDDGSPATVPGSPANVLICGETSAGKSYLAGLLIEGWIHGGYTVLVIDMEGDHVTLGRQLHNAVVLDSQPSAAELLSVLRQQSVSVVLDVSGLPPSERLDYLRTLPPLIEAERAAWGLPHWIVVDEAHLTLADGGIAADVFRPTDHGYCLVTYRPEQLCPEALAAIDLTITADPPTLATQTGLTGTTRTARLRETGSLERPFTVSARRTPHVRHRRKYAIAGLPEHRWFHFRDRDGRIAATAADLTEFSRIIQEVDSRVLAHHLERGDFSRWILGTLQDRDLAAAVGALERNLLARRAADLAHARERLTEEVDSRYLISE
jgi:hydroxymethylpyrimidine pyrophosphatase-like HAD family hydrolase